MYILLLSEVSIDAISIGVLEGETASVCVIITNTNLLDPSDPSTVQVSTTEEGGSVLTCATKVHIICTL